MKYTLFAICLFISASSAAQIPLDSIYRDGAEWTQFYDYEWWASSNLSNKGTIAYTLTIGGDTTIGTTTYKKLYYTQKGGYYKISQENFTRYVQPFGPDYIGRLRLSGKKVYITTWASEILYYDFDLNIGDTFNNWVVTAIDSVEVQPGQYLKKFIFHFNSRYIIEGLGWHYGLLNTIDIIGPYQGNRVHYGLCFSSGDMFYHYKPSCPGVDWYLLEKCFDMNALSIRETSSQKELTIYPNPSQSFFTLEGNCKAKEAKITIVNMLGMVVHAEVIPIENNYIKYRISTGNLPDGIYQLLLNTDESQKAIPLKKG